MELIDLSAADRATYEAMKEAPESAYYVWRNKYTLQGLTLRDRLEDKYLCIVAPGWLLQVDAKDFDYNATVVVDPGANLTDLEELQFNAITKRIHTLRVQRYQPPYIMRYREIFGVEPELFPAPVDMDFFVTMSSSMAIYAEALKRVNVAPPDGWHYNSQIDCYSKPAPPIPLPPPITFKTLKTMLGY